MRTAFLSISIRWTEANEKLEKRSVTLNTHSIKIHETNPRRWVAEGKMKLDNEVRNMHNMAKGSNGSTRILAKRNTVDMLPPISSRSGMTRICVPSDDAMISRSPNRAGIKASRLLIGSVYKTSPNVAMKLSWKEMS